MAKPLTFLATAAKGLEPVLAEELRAIGLNRVTEGRGLVRFMGKATDGYRACLWSRIASRILLRLGQFEANDADGLYRGVQQISWDQHIGENKTIAVDFTGSSRALRHEGFAARVVKDAIVDQLREKRGERPDVERYDPDVRIRTHLNRGLVSISVDFSGNPLHLRSGGKGVRHAGLAPLKETLAAALLRFAKWPSLSKQGRPLVDPMCGSGTFLIEAAAMAFDIAPGIRRQRWGFQGWAGYERAAWRGVLLDAQQRRDRGVARMQSDPPMIFGWDAEKRVVGSANANLGRHGLERAVALSVGSIEDLVPPSGHQPGILVVNPPYGERLGDVEELRTLYGDLGDKMRHVFLGWTGHVLTGSRELAGAIGLRAARRIPVHNGAIECRFLVFPIAEHRPTGGGPRWRQDEPTS